MKKELHLKLDPEFHACLKEIVNQQNTNMTNWVRGKILDELMKDEFGKTTDGESWIDDYKRNKRKGYKYALCDHASHTNMSNM
jgi:hypothetical protein